jgi:hypothetical protein
MLKIGAPGNAGSQNEQANLDACMMPANACMNEYRCLQVFEKAFAPDPACISWRWNVI